MPTASRTTCPPPHSGPHRSRTRRAATPPVPCREVACSLLWKGAGRLAATPGSFSPWLGRPQALPHTRYGPAACRPRRGFSTTSAPFRACPRPPLPPLAAGRVVSVAPPIPDGRFFSFLGAGPGRPRRHVCGPRPVVRQQERDPPDQAARAVHSQ
eukprot:scaffold13697_cov83-Isochrysis_galbana.AAC.1